MLVEIVRADVDSRQVDFCLVKRLKMDKPAAMTLVLKTCNYEFDNFLFGAGIDDFQFSFFV